MQSKLPVIEKESFSAKDPELRRVYSEASAIFPNITINDNDINDINDHQALKVECECCGMSEDFTPTYVSQIKSFFCSKWVCGLCAEVVKEKIGRDPTLKMEQALESHTELCKKFNGTTRVNPKLSLALGMREIARKSSQRRSSISNDRSSGLPNIGTTLSRVARIDGC